LTLIINMLENSMALMPSCRTSNSNEVEMPQVILFNGPPRSGKDTCTKWLMEKHGDIFQRLRMAQALKDGVHAMLGLPVFAEEFDDVKGEELPEFFGKTPRSAYIAAAEQFMKVHFGPECFGHIWLRMYNEQFLEPAIALVPDTGFGPEIQPLINHFGADQIWLFRIYRKGCDFAQDSRGYVNGVLPFEKEIVNIDGEPERMLQQLEYLLTVNGLFTEWYRR